MKKFRVKWLKFWYSGMLVKLSTEGELPLLYELTVKDSMGERHYTHLGNNEFLPKKKRKERQIFFQITILYNNNNGCKRL